MQATGTDRGGYYISTGTYPGIYLKGQHKTNNDDDEYVYSQYIVNSVSVNLTPFSSIQITFEPEYGRGSDRMGGDCRIYLLDTSKKSIKNSGWIRAGGEAVVSLDVIGVNQHAFFRIDSISIEGATYGEMWIKKIAFVK